jgi:ATP-dependent helicase Lhr and Lhr-like helicase
MAQQARSNPPALARFHPAVAGWFADCLGAPTDAQARAWQAIAARRHTLVTAPTGSGKTLAAFLSALDDLVQQGLAGDLPEGVQVVYVSPLKALSNDIQRNLQEPLAGIRERLQALGLPDVPIRTAVRTGDTPAAERERMRRHPPHVLVTTPESLFILLTSDRGRQMLRDTRTVIVDELHAVAGVKRGAHLALTLERLNALCGTQPLRIGLSATVKPLSDMARFLIGARDEDVAIVDAGHVRERDLALEVPRAPLDTLMSNEVWGELYDRLAELIGQHRTTLVFVNQRRLAERAARHLAERIGEQFVTSHHGSLAREHRFDAEQRLKSGQLKALVTTSSLELGIDIGHVDLVCQLGSPRSISAFLQRVGRAGHAIGAVPKGRLFPLSLGDLLECSALLHSAAQGELDRTRLPRAPLDVLAQQVIAEVTSGEYTEQALFDLVRRALPYRDLTREDFDAVIRMLAQGYATRRGRRGAYLHHDQVNHRLRARDGARLAALTNAGVIPDQFDYGVVLLPEEHRIGSVAEDFAFESIPGDIFQLGNTAYRINKIETGKVYVEDARGQPPTIPFWFGEAPSRSEELSTAVSSLTESAEARLREGVETCEQWLESDLGLPRAAAQQLAHYLAASLAALGALPTRDTVILERFFDEVGDTHLVIHSPFGSRINRAWGLALRKRFCRQFNFELQASALEDSIVLSLGPTHSFPLEQAAGYLKSPTALDVLTQALLDAPMFGTRWRWNATVALAVRRMNGGKPVPPPFQRADSEDLLTVVFPDQLACAENLSGDREIPEHPLVKQTLDDCLHETMDADGFLELLRRIERGDVRVLARDLAAPSPLSQAILNARPYAFLDDGDAEGRRTRSVAQQRLMDVQSAAALGQIDAEAVAKVCAEAWPDVDRPDELHDALVMYGFLTAAEVERLGAPLLDELIAERRVTRARIEGGAVWSAAERLHELVAAQPAAVLEPALPLLAEQPEPAFAQRELLRSRLELSGPVYEIDLGAPLAMSAEQVHTVLLALEAEGGAMRLQDGRWCDRRLLARIHRYTRERRHAEVKPVPPAQFLRFLFVWQGLASSADDARREGEEGLFGVLRQLEGYPMQAAAWEEEVLPGRLRDYAPSMLDRLCTAGRVAWCRPQDGSSRSRSGPVRTTPILFATRQSLGHWQAPPVGEEPPLSARATRALEALHAHGASFFSDLLHDTGLLRAELENALGELVSQGLVSCDAFAGLRGLIEPEQRRGRRRRRRPLTAVDEAGRWARVRPPRPSTEPALADPRVDHVARVLLRRYGVVFRKIIEREHNLPPWRELHYVYRRLEARGEIRGGRFVSGFSGEQFALPDAAACLRKIANAPGEELVAISGADPLNLVGILTPGERVPALAGNRVLFAGGVPVAVHVGGDVKQLRPLDTHSDWDVKTLLIRKRGVANLHRKDAAG